MTGMETFLMTADGKGGLTMQKNLNVVISPNEVAQLAEKIIYCTPKQDIHAKFDQLSNKILCSLGYSDFVDLFKGVIGGDHTTTQGTDHV